MVTSTKIGRSTPRKSPVTASASKKSAKPNASILKFFKKTEKPEDSLFVDAIPDLYAQGEDLYGAHEINRYNEAKSPVKRRKVVVGQDTSIMDTPLDSVATTTTTKLESGTRIKTKKGRINTPFVMESESEDDDENTSRNVPFMAENITLENPTLTNIRQVDGESCNDDGLDKTSPLPGSNHDDSTYAQFDELGDFGHLDGFDPDAFEGEEMREMRFMRAQAHLESEETEGLFGQVFSEDLFDDGTVVQSCPVCNGSLIGVSADQATHHVNSCLDGDPVPLPINDKIPPTNETEVEASTVSKRFVRTAGPRPGQENPSNVDGQDTKAASAFTKLMSNNAEDSAWAIAAAAENSSRGRPFYERTCPFYKIMPGFNICVDAFRYGAVEGCNAYFLSHFHSDHYIGLTANWIHGPIYCSKVTGSLVKQQLRTAAKWVVELDFEKPYDIPGTTGASVTMMPANHCPGSSLFLFQKSISRGANNRVQRILHCGDFRACPEHVSHPLLKPDVLDSDSGKKKPQKIDICYLDTTYLNPRYSFPPQDDVIKACADLCASMSPDPDCNDNIWDRSAKAIGTPAVSKFFQAANSHEEKSASKKKARCQQRLLVICGTYSIGKERICIAIAKALGSKIFASAAKMKICKQLQDPELSSLLTSDPLEAQVHMQMLMEIRAETLQDYLDSYRPHFSRIIGFRPSGWNFRPSNGKAIGTNASPASIPTQQILHGKGWRTRFGRSDFVAQRGSTKEAMCFGVPYSEHSSFRELAMFVMGLRIEKIVPTVNVGSDHSRRKMKGWLDRWMMERRKGGLLEPLVEGRDDQGEDTPELWDGKSGKGGGAWW